MPTSSRMRRHRERRAEGVRLITVEVSEAEVQALDVKGFFPLQGRRNEAAIREAKHAIQDLGMLGFHFHPIMGHFAVNDRRLYPLFEVINELKVPVMIDVGTTGMGAGMPGGMGVKIRHAHPSAIDELAADFPDLTIIAAHIGWPWVEEMTAVALHKGNVF